MDWIQGDKFKHVAHFNHAPDWRHNDDYDRMKNTVKWDNEHLAGRINIIYTHTFYASGLLNIIAQYPSKLFILITHNSDMNINSEWIPFLPDNVVKWYAQNVNCNHPKIESIPIGLENDRWFPEIQKKQKMLKYKEAWKTMNNTSTQLVYMNHNIATNVAERLKPYQLLEKHPWVTSVRGKNGMNFESYLINLLTHDFVICPNGNGIDTHRVWETLYMGSIPVMKKDINNQFYTDLPICFVNDWDDITQDFLLMEKARIKSQTWNMDKLNFSYWKNKILNHE